MTTSRGHLTLLATVLFSGVAALILLVAPVVVGQLIAEYAFSLEQAGYIIAVELAGISLATVPALWWMNHINWRRAAYMAIAAMVAVNIASVWMQSFPALLMMRSLASLAAGSLMVICLAAIGMTENKDRNFGFWVVGQLVLGAIGLVSLPLLFQRTGLWAFYVGVTIAILALIPFVRYLPTAAAANATSRSDAASWPLIDAIKRAPSAALGILGIFVFYIVISGVWTYVERIGTAASISGPIIGVTLSVATVMGIIGAGLASASGGRVARHYMICLGFGLLLASVLMLWQSPAMLRYVIAVLIFKFTWTFILPFMLASISMSDPSGKLIVLTNMVIGGGLAVGPALAARVLGAGLGYDALLLMLTMMGVLSALAMVHASMKAAVKIM